MNRIPTIPQRLSRLITIPFFLAIVSLTACGGGPGGGSSGGGNSSTPSVLYVASGDNGAGEILAFAIDPTNGSLSAPTSFSGPEVFYELRSDPSGAFLYGSADGVRIYSVNSSTGALTEVAGSPFRAPQVGADGGPIAVSPNGKFLFYSDHLGNITTFSISAGTLAPNGIVVEDDNQPYHFAVDPAGSFLYVANHSDFSPEGSQFSVFAIDQSSGALSPVPGSPFGFENGSGGSGPAGIAIHPNGNFLYSTLSNVAGLEGMSVARSTGALSLTPGSPWNTTGQIPNFVSITPSGNFLYVSGTGPGAIQAFSIAPSGGGLTAVGTYQGAGTEIVFDSAGKFLYTVYPAFHEVAMSAIDQTTGALSQPVVVPAGADPGAIAVIHLP
jgi:6-phosphogluconolactonase